MKARPRRVENRVAEVLNERFDALGAKGVHFERIPVLGREGPDLTWDTPLRLAIDVKSRKTISQPLFRYVSRSTKVWQGVEMDSLFAWPLHDLEWNTVFGIVPFRCVDVVSVVLNRWMQHMAEWARPRQLIPALVLHRPGMDIDRSLLVIFSADKRILQANLARCIPAPETQEE